MIKYPCFCIQWFIYGDLNARGGGHLVLICTSVCLWGAVIFTLSGSIFLNLNTPVWEQNGKKPHPVWEQRIKKIRCSPVWEQKFEKSIPFWEHFAENDTRLGSKNGENYTLSSGTYPVPKTSKSPPPGLDGAMRWDIWLRLQKVFKKRISKIVNLPVQ